VTLEDLGHVALLILVVAVALFLLYKWWQRHRFLMQIRMTRISTDELRNLLQSIPGTVVLDVRSAESRAQSGWIPGSIHVRDLSQLAADHEDEVVVYCDCPNDASAATVARALKERGFKKVRPLAGGIDAWRARGLPVDVDSLDQREQARSKTMASAARASG
jgi:rhodanese-related sulfurtransferase